MSSSGDQNAVDDLSLPEHWKELLRGSKDKPEFFEFCMETQVVAEEIAGSEIAMDGIFSYDEG